MVRTPHFHCWGPGLDPLVRELRSHKRRSTAKNKKQKKKPCSRIRNKNTVICGSEAGSTSTWQQKLSVPLANKEGLRVSLKNPKKKYIIWWSQLVRFSSLSLSLSNISQQARCFRKGVNFSQWTYIHRNLTNWWTDPRGDERNKYALTSAHFKMAHYTKQKAKLWVFKIVLFGKSASYKRAAAKYRDLCNNYLFLLNVKEWVVSKESKQ